MCTHMKSSLPSLLDAYLPPQLKKQGDKGQQNNPQKDGESGKHRRLPSSDEDEEDLKMKATRKDLQEQHYLEIYKNVYRLCKVLQLHYMDLLSKRVQKQRHEIKERDLRFQEKTEKRKMEHNSTRRLFGHQSECSQLHHDIKYLKSVPKSHYYMIVELQDQLVENGILKNQEDYEEFWQLLKQSSHCSQFETKLQDVKLKMNKSRPHLKTRRAPHVGRVKDSHPTASGLPRLPTFQHTNHPKSKQKKVHEESEQMFPKMKNLKQVQETPPHREGRLDKLYQMYNRSIANMAITQRLLKRSGQLAEFKEPSVQDFGHDLASWRFPFQLLMHEACFGHLHDHIVTKKALSMSSVSPPGSSQTFLEFPTGKTVFCQEHDTTVKKIRSQKTRHDWFSSQNDPQICEKPNSRSFESHNQEETSEALKAEIASQDLKPQGQNQKTPNPVNYYVPLNMEEILLNSNIVEAKRPSSLWTNYTT